MEECRGLCSGQALIGRLHSDYGQKEKVNRRLLGGLYSVFRNKLCVVVLHSGVLVGVPGVPSGLSSVVFRVADGGRKCHRVSLNSTYFIRGQHEIFYLNFYFILSPPE